MSVAHAPCELLPSRTSCWRLIARTFPSRRLSFHILITAAIAGNSQLIRLQLLLDAIAGREMFRFSAGFDLPPFAGNAKAPAVGRVYTHIPFSQWVKVGDRALGYFALTFFRLVFAPFDDELCSGFSASTLILSASLVNALSVSPSSSNVCCKSLAALL